MTFVNRSSLYTAKSLARHRLQMTPKGKDPKVWKQCTPRQSCPEALGSPTGYVVRSGQSLLWPHPSHSSPATGLFASSSGHEGSEWVPNLSSVSVCACHPQDPGGPIGCFRLFLPRPLWSSSSPHGLDIRVPHARWFPRGLCNEAESGSLALRPAQWLAFHQQRRLLPSFRRASRPGRRRLSLHRHTVNSYDRTCTGKTHYRMGCERRHGEATMQDRIIGIGATEINGVIQLSRAKASRRDGPTPAFILSSLSPRLRDSA